MTEGIIQKVFRDFKDRNNYDVRDMVIHLPELEKELIGEIKKYSKRLDFGYLDTFDLIGDEA